MKIKQNPSSTNNILEVFSPLFTCRIKQRPLLHAVECCLNMEARLFWKRWIHHASTEDVTFLQPSDKISLQLNLWPSPPRNPNICPFKLWRHRSILTGTWTLHTSAALDQYFPPKSAFVLACFDSGGQQSFCGLVWAELTFEIHAVWCSLSVVMIYWSGCLW